MTRRNVVHNSSGSVYGCGGPGSIGSTGESEYSDSSFKYTRMKSSKSKHDADGFSSIQFQSPPPRIPWKAIGLAIALFLLGSLLLIIGGLILGGVIDAKYSDRAYPLLILGSIMFIPGFYHVRLAYCAFQGYKGYSFNDIPDFD